MQIEHFFPQIQVKTKKKKVFIKNRKLISPIFALRCTPIQIIGGIQPNYWGIYPPFPLVSAPLFTLIVITHTFIAPRCDIIGVPLLWSFRTNVVLMVLSENCDFCLEKLNSLKSASLLPIISPSSVYVC